MPAPPDGQRSSGFTGTLKSKWGPLPVWGWLLVVTILAVAYYLWSRRSGAQQSTAPVAGQPGVVVINQEQPPPIPLPPVKPPKPPEDHDKDEDDETKSKGHDHDDHHRHRRHDRDVDDSMGPPPPKPPPIPLPPIGNPPPPPSPVPQPVNVGSLFPKIGPVPARGGRARKRG